jgi:hypothetical protein
MPFNTNPNFSNNICIALEMELNKHMKKGKPHRTKYMKSQHSSGCYASYTHG